MKLPRIPFFGHFTPKVTVPVFSPEDVRMGIERLSKHRNPYLRTCAEIIRRHPFKVQQDFYRIIRLLAISKE